MKKLSSLDISLIKQEVLKNFNNYQIASADDDWFCKCYIIAIREYCKANKIAIEDILLYNVAKKEYE